MQALVGLTATYAYESYSSQKANEISIDTSKLYIDNEGNITYHFDIGEHVVEVSRNDAFYHKIENVEGYVIETVEVKG